MEIQSLSSFGSEEQVAGAAAVGGGEQEGGGEESVLGNISELRRSMRKKDGRKAKGKPRRRPSNFKKTSEYRGKSLWQMGGICCGTHHGVAG